MDAPLVELARAHGVATDYRTDRGHRVAVAPDTLVAVLAALGVDAATPGAARRSLQALRHRRASRPLPPCVVVRSGSAAARRLALPDGAEAWATLEDGRRLRLPVAGTGAGGAAADLTGVPVGRHTLRVDTPRGTADAPLLVAPERLATGPERGWGLLTQLYSVLSRHSWGMGDLADLARLATWAGGTLGAGFLQLNPLHAAVPGPLPDPSPYRPSSRRFPDPTHLRVEAVPEYALLDAATRERVDALAARGRALGQAVLREGALIDREAVRELKHQALRLLHRVPLGPARRAAYQAYCEREGAGLTDFATWCALAEVHGPAWRSWPAPLRDPRSGAVAEARRALADRVDYHRWTAWLVDEQLAAAQAAATAAGMPVGLVHDLAVGVDPQGADAWALRHHLADGVTVGAPPDDFNPRGQDWGLPPWRPDALAASGYAPYADLLRTAARHAGALRVDHVMGLFRLWWVPEGRPPSEGTYVSYDGRAMLAVLALQAHRAGALVIGEDLGTVEREVREEMADLGILGTSVLRFEYLGGSVGRSGPLPPEHWRRDCVATLTTHDLPSTAAWLSGEHVELRRRLGLLTRPVEQEAAEAAAERDGWLAELRRLGLLSDDPADGALPVQVAALHRFLLLTPARLLGVWLPDAVGDRRPQNLPGTSTEYPNWRLPVADATGRPLALEELTRHPGFAALAELFAAVRNRPAAPGGS
ncbi:4-alpha-glucanotransferase [Allostreptomyces psammosilenae]|uniref:4-alpha-glucanotransferase n=1 Tax=Allostreptomyces psammosilenae TaxID=1892865 RepID=UPI0015C7D38E